MNRRSFLGALGFAPIAAIVPAEAEASRQIPWPEATPAQPVPFWIERGIEDGHFVVKQHFTRAQGANLEDVRRWTQEVEAAVERTYRYRSAR